MRLGVPIKKSIYSAVTYRSYRCSLPGGELHVGFAFPRLPWYTASTPLRPRNPPSFNPYLGVKNVARSSLDRIGDVHDDDVILALVLAQEGVGVLVVQLQPRVVQHAGSPFRQYISRSVYHQLRFYFGGWWGGSHEPGDNVNSGTGDEPQEGEAGLLFFVFRRSGFANERLRQEFPGEGKLSKSGYARTAERRYKPRPQ